MPNTPSTDVHASSTDVEPTSTDATTVDAGTDDATAVGAGTDGPDLDDTDLDDTDLDDTDLDDTDLDDTTDDAGTDVPLFAQASSPFTTSNAPAWALPPAPTSPSLSADVAPASNGDTAGAEQIDWALVTRLKSSAVDKIDDARKGQPRRLTEADLRQLSVPIIAQTVQHHAAVLSAQGHSWDADTQRRYRKAVIDSQLGYGRLEPLFHIPTAEDIIIVDCEEVVIRHNDGTVERRPPVADSVEELLEQLQKIGSLSTPKRTLDASHTDMTVMLRDRFRLHAISDEVALHARVVIRQHLLREVSLADMSDLEMMPAHVAHLLHATVRGGHSIVVAGAQGAGKTTLLRALIDAIPPWEFFGTLETDIELFAHLMPERQHNLALVSRSGMGERDNNGVLRGAVGISELVDAALRQSLDRMIVGEMRGPESAALLQAMQVGTGTLSTTHAKGADTIIDRIAGGIAQGHVYSKAEALDELGHCLDLVVYVRVVYDENGRKRRSISDIRSVHPSDTSTNPGGVARPVMGTIYQTGRTELWTPTEELQELMDTHNADLHRYRQPGQKVAAS